MNNKNAENILESRDKQSREQYTSFEENNNDFDS